MADWVTAARVGEIAPGEVKNFDLQGRRAVVCNVEGEYFCVDDVCSHDGGPLGQGELYGDQIECPRHGAMFDVKTGRAVTLPAVTGIDTHEVRVEDGEIRVKTND